MTVAVVYALSVDSGVADAPDATPLPVLSRQLPRLAVHLLNGQGDRGLRFFPFIGRHGDHRRFFVVEELLAVAALLELHGQTPAPQLVMDGCFHSGGLRLRIHEGASGRERFDADIRFDPLEPLSAVTRMMFELTGILGWPGAPPRLPDLEGGALVSYLVARDNLLGLEADLVPSGHARPSKNALLTVTLAPAEPEVRDVALEIWSRQASGELAAPVAEHVAEACTVINTAGMPEEHVADFLTSAAAVLESCRERKLALAQYERAASLWPRRADAACRAATLHFEAGRLPAARHILRRTLDAGQRSPTVLAQLAVVEEQLGDRPAYSRLLEELLHQSGLQPPMVRLVVSFLLEHQRVDEALALTEDHVRRQPGHPGSWFDRGRALVAAARHAEGVDAFEACLRLEPADALRAEADRHLRFARAPELAQAMRDVDEALIEGDLRLALRRARRLVRGHDELAETWLFLGVTLQRLHRIRRAERALRRALELDPELGEAHNRLGILLVGRGQHRDGYDALREAVRLQPREPSALVHLAQACHYLGLRDEGEEALARAARLGGADDAVEAVRRSFYSS